MAQVTQCVTISATLYRTSMEYPWCIHRRTHSKISFCCLFGVSLGNACLLVVRYHTKPLCVLVSVSDQLPDVLCAWPSEIKCFQTANNPRPCSESVTCLLWAKGSGTLRGIGGPVLVCAIAQNLCLSGSVQTRCHDLRVRAMY